MELKARKVIALYKGSKEYDKERVEKANKGFQNVGYIQIRSQERIRFSTGINNTTDENLIIYPEKTIMEEKGLITSSAVLLIKPGEDVEIMLYNPTPFLIRIEKDEVIAKI